MADRSGGRLGERRRSVAGGADFRIGRQLKDAVPRLDRNGLRDQADQAVIHLLQCAPSAAAWAPGGRAPAGRLTADHAVLIYRPDLWRSAWRPRGLAGLRPGGLSA